MHNDQELIWYNRERVYFPINLTFFSFNFFCIFITYNIYAIYTENWQIGKLNVLEISFILQYIPKRKFANFILFF